MHTTIPLVMKAACKSRGTGIFFQDGGMFFVMWDERNLTHTYCSWMIFRVYQYHIRLGRLPHSASEDAVPYFQLPLLCISNCLDPLFFFILEPKCGFCANNKWNQRSKSQAWHQRSGRKNGLQKQVFTKRIISPRTCLTLVLIGKDLILVGLKPKKGVKTVLGKHILLILCIELVLSCDW